jgi:hypothetical protein
MVYDSIAYRFEKVKTSIFFFFKQRTSTESSCSISYLSSVHSNQSTQGIPSPNHLILSVCLNEKLDIISCWSIQQVFVASYLCKIPHTTMCVSSYYYKFVLILLYICPHTTIRVLMLLHICPHATMCVLILLCVSSYCRIRMLTYDWTETESYVSIRQHTHTHDWPETEEAVAAIV